MDLVNSKPCKVLQQLAALSLRALTKPAMLGNVVGYASSGNFGHDSMTMVCEGNGQWQADKFLVSF